MFMLVHTCSFFSFRYVKWLVATIVFVQPPADPDQHKPLHKVSYNSSTTSH